MIEAVAARIRLHRFDMRPVMKELLSSQLFFDAVQRRSIIKSPVELVIGALRMLIGTVKWLPVTRLLANLGQNVFEPPSVKGWEGGRLWINSATMVLRINFATELASSDKLGTLQSTVMENATVPSDMVARRLETLLFGDGASDDLHRQFTHVHSHAEGSGERKLRTLLQVMLSSPEFQLQ
jgi:uncharacterized protein (DUF1800 family)